MINFNWLHFDHLRIKPVRWLLLARITALFAACNGSTNEAVQPANEDANATIALSDGEDNPDNTPLPTSTPEPTALPTATQSPIIAAKGENVYVELKTGPGKLTSTAAITPNGKAEVEVNVGFKRYEARRMAASVLAYFHA